MGRFFCPLLLTAALFFCAAWTIGTQRCEAQPVFFRLLFPMLLPSAENMATHGEALIREAMFL